MLLDQLGMLGGGGGGQEGSGGQRFAISPQLLKGALGLRGAAIAITGFNPMKKEPVGVAILHPGDVDVVRGLIETGLPIGGERVEAIEGFPTYQIDGKIYATLTSRLVVLSNQRSLIQGVVRRLGGGDHPSLADDEVLRPVLADRGDDSLLFFCVNAKRVMPMVSSMMAMAAAKKPELAMVNAALDLNGMEVIAGNFGLGKDGVGLEIKLRLSEGHRNLVYNLLRMPTIDKSVFEYVPEGAAAFAAISLNEPTYSMGRAAKGDGENPPIVTAMDFGRELFGNIVSLSVFVLPPDGSAARGPGSIPDVAAVITVNDPTKSEALWTQILGIASMAAGAPTSDGKTVSIGGIDATAYQFPPGVTILVGTKDDKLFIATTREAFRRAGAADKKGGSILNDKAFAASLANLDKTTSKAAFINPGRCLQIARQFMGQGQRQKTEPFVDLLSRTVVAVRTNESDQELRITAQVSGLPDIGPLVSQLIEREGQRHSRRHESRSAQHSGQRNNVIEAVAHSDHERHDARDDRRRFEELARNPESREEALRIGKRIARSISDNPKELNNFAWDLLTNDDYGNQFDAHALRLAQKACEQTDFERWAFLDTLALASYRAGQIDNAIEFQKKAVAIQGGGHRGLNEALDRYKAHKSGL
ncbi:MAG: hypothetical protein IID41_12230 [Planctomycetes bacterium]|nr:hypothetical protein [Planctomycetota bacterium]